MNRTLKNKIKEMEKSLSSVHMEVSNFKLKQNSLESENTLLKKFLVENHEKCNENEDDVLTQYHNFAKEFQMQTPPETFADDSIKVPVCETIDKPKDTPMTFGTTSPVTDSKT